MPMIPNYAWTSAAAEDLSGRFGGEYDRTRIKGVGFDGIIVPIKRSGTGIPRRFLAGMMKTAKDHPEVVPVIGGIDERNGRWAMRIGFVHRDTPIVPPLVPLEDSFGQSTHSSYTTGIEGTDIDHLITHPHTGWMGNRGVRATFGEDVNEYGRLYRSPPFHHLEQASHGDRGALQARSGGSGLRGGRPTFGGEPQVYGADARIEFGPLRYEGSPVGAAVLGLAGLVLLFKGPMGG